MVGFTESNFYKALQDFFINNYDKDAFLEMLSEFYNRTEHIIEKNSVKDELIKELRELYIEFNEKGIDENIVREKVNYFVENNVKIQDIITKVIINKNNIITNTNNIKNISSQLDTIEKMNKTNNEIQRKFKPAIGNFLDLNPSGGQMISNEEIDIALSKCKKHGIEKIVIQPWLTWDNSSSILSLKNDLDRLKYIEEKCIEIGLEVACLKLHMYSINFNNVSDKVTFKNQYKDIVQLLCNKFSNSSVNLFIPFNECYEFYKKDSEHLEFVNEVLDIVKSTNFKCGISTMGGVETVNMDSTLKGKVDVFCINSYPKISYKKERTTLEDSISAWNNSYELKCYKEIKRQYPFKDIMMSETGCNDHWICLANPGDWTLSESYNTNGKAPALMLEGLFNSDFKDLINEVWWCYYPTILNEECKNIIERYTGGIYEL